MSKYKYPPGKGYEVIHDTGHWLECEIIACGNPSGLAFPNHGDIEYTIDIPDNPHPDEPGLWVIPEKHIRPTAHKGDEDG